MNDYNDFSFDSSNAYFMDAQETVEKIKNDIENLKGDLLIEKNNILDLSNTSPVGFELSSCLDNIVELDNLIDVWNEIINNANHLREVGDLINKGFTDVFDELFDSQEQFLSFLYEVAVGNQTIASLFGNPMIGSVDYYQILKDGWTAQGYSKIDDKFGSKIIITAHGKYSNDEARLYIYDEKTGKLETVVHLDHNDHVGGISYDSDHQILWVAGDDGKVHSYDYKKLQRSVKDNKLENGIVANISLRDYTNIEIPNDIQVGDLVSNEHNRQDGMDSIYYYDGKLYSCTYSGKGELLETNLDITRSESGVDIQDETVVVGELNGATQGLAVYKENGKQYVITASSAVYVTPQSRLTKWEIDNGNMKPIGYKYVDHTGLEGIEIEDGYVKGVYEKGWSFWNENQSTEVLTSVNDINEPPNKTTDTMLTIGGNFWDVTNGPNMEYISKP